MRNRLEGMAISSIGSSAVRIGTKGFVCIGLANEIVRWRVLNVLALSRSYERGEFSSSEEQSTNATTQIFVGALCSHSRTNRTLTRQRHKWIYKYMTGPSDTFESFF